MAILADRKYSEIISIIKFLVFYDPNSHDRGMKQRFENEESSQPWPISQHNDHVNQFIFVFALMINAQKSQKDLISDNDDILPCMHGFALEKFRGHAGFNALGYDDSSDGEEERGATTLCRAAV